MMCLDIECKKTSCKDIKCKRYFLPLIGVVALLAFEEANKIKPTFWQSLNNQALVLYELNKIGRAILRA